jgi:hypothetical protein
VFRRQNPMNPCIAHDIYACANPTPIPRHYWYLLFSGHSFNSSLQGRHYHTIISFPSLNLYHSSTHLPRLMTNMLAARLHAALLATRMAVLATVQRGETTELGQHDAAERVAIYLVAEVVARDAVFAVDEGDGEVVVLGGGAEHAEGEEDEGVGELHGLVGCC